MNLRDIQSIFDQDGRPVHANEIIKEQVDKNLAWFYEKQDEFEDALELKCQKEDEVYNKMGFDSQIGMHLYQVGMEIYGISINQHGINWQIVGQIR